MESPQGGFMTLRRLALPFSLALCLALVSLFSLGSAAPAATKTKPCSNKKPRVFVLCKPLAGTWQGVVSQEAPQAPGGHFDTPVQFTVERKGATKNGTRVEAMRLP